MTRYTKDKSTTVTIRVSAAEKRAIQRAAKAERCSMSSWLRVLALCAATRVA